MKRKAFRKITEAFCLMGHAQKIENLLKNNRLEVSHQYRLPVINRDDLERIEKTEFLNQ
ncbi:MAG: hypothetical protein IT236_12995 [Bacteroidia bacterium]|nr:hypothetical protein [Bacteroidia bacterium]